MKYLQALKDFINELRRSEPGCAWTKSQTHESLAPQTIEEAYELADAILHHDIKSVHDELADMLYHLLFYVQICEEQDTLNLEQLAATALEKHQRRMPSKAELATLDADGVNHRWDEKKAQERQGQNSVLDGVTKTLPSLFLATKIQNRAASIGFDWPNSEGVLNKINEEVEEVRQAIVHSESSTRLEEEYGDLLLAVTNLGRHVKLNPEISLLRACEKFERRFRHMESNSDQDLHQLDIEALEALWAKSKR